MAPSYLQKSSDSDEENEDESGQHQKSSANSSSKDLLRDTDDVAFVRRKDRLSLSDFKKSLALIQTKDYERAFGKYYLK